MSIIQGLKVASVLLVAGATASGVNSLAQKGTSGAEPRPERNVQAARAADAPVIEVKPGKLESTVVERGSVEATRSENVYCNVEGQTTIRFIVPNETRVKKGQRVCELDSARLRDQLVDQRITTKVAEAVYQNAKLEREEAELADQAYREDLFPRQQRETEGELKVAHAELALAEAQLKTIKAVPNPINAELKRAELDVARAKLALERANNRLHILTSYTKGGRIKDLARVVDRTRSNELAKEATWELERGKEQKLARQIAACNIVAPIDGMVVNANDPNRNDLRAIEAGATVRERQLILRMSDIDGLMQVNVKVHESVIDRIKPGQRARVKVDAFPGEMMAGLVGVVAPLPDPFNWFDHEKFYTTWVKIGRGPAGLRPGMAAQAEIFVDVLDNVLSVPVGAVLHYGGKAHVAVKKPDGTFDWREVTLGVSNSEHVEIQEGIKSGELVAAKPLALMSEEEKREKLGAPSQPPDKARVPR